MPGRTTPGAIRAALYARVSTTDQATDGQLERLRTYADARGWLGLEFIDHGLSGAAPSRPALDRMLAAARSRTLDVVLCTKLDRLARSTLQLVTLGKELDTLGVDLVVLDQAIDTTTPSGRLLFHVLAAIAEFERDLIRDRVIAGLRRARAQGRQLGRPPRYRVNRQEAQRLRAAGVSLRGVARVLGVHPSAVSRALARS